MSAHAAIRRSDRKASQLLGVTLTRDRAVSHNKPGLVDRLRRFTFRPRFGKDRAAPPPEDFVWDEPNPFGPPDPSQEWLRALIQAEIAHTRRFEATGPLEDVPNEGEDEDDEDDDEDDDDDDGYDEDYDGDDDDGQSESENNNHDTLSPIVLPRLLPIPLRVIPSTHSLHHPPPPPPSPSPSFDIAPSNEEPLPWADHAEAYNNIAEAEERAFRKAKRDAHRSRSKALAILGPEASSAL